MTTMTETDDIDLSDLDLDLDLDTTWMDSTETCLADYTPFYKKDVTRLTVVRAYINLGGTVVRVSSTEEELDAPNTLTVRHMCALAGADRVWKKYLYTVTVDEDAVEELEELEELGDDDNFFRELTDAVQDVIIERTIEHFHDVNTLFMLFKDVPMDPAPANLGSAAAVLEIELGSANPLSRKNRRHKPVSVGGAKTRRLH
jgi:hypothetical protein